MLDQPAAIHPALEPYLNGSEGRPAAFVIEDYAPQGASTQGCERVIFTGGRELGRLPGRCSRFLTAAAVVEAGLHYTAAAV